MNEEDKEDFERLISNIEREWKPATSQALTIFKNMNELQRDRVISRKANGVGLLETIIINIRSSSVNKKNFVQTLRMLAEDDELNIYGGNDKFIYRVADLTDALYAVVNQLGSSYYKSMGNEGEKDDPLGRVAFSPQRSDDVPFEKNTSRETKLFKNLSSHFSHKKKAMTLDDVELIQQFMKDGKYKKIFHEPEQRFVFRGMNVSKEWLTTVLGDERELTDEGLITHRFKFTPFNNVSSWSTSNAVASSFSSGDSKHEYNVILYALVRENPLKFVMCPGGLYHVIQFSNFEDELEVIGLGDIKVNEISWERRESH